MLIRVGTLEGALFQETGSQFRDVAKKSENRRSVSIDSHINLASSSGKEYLPLLRGHVNNNEIRSI